MENEHIEFWLKRASDVNRKDIKLSMSRSCTQADVKARVHVEYDDRPEAACITVSFHVTCIDTSKFFLGSTFWIRSGHIQAKQDEVFMRFCSSSMEVVC